MWRVWGGGDTVDTSKKKKKKDCRGGEMEMNGSRPPGRGERRDLRLRGKIFFFLLCVCLCGPTWWLDSLFRISWVAS
jgi:hypothetical protein